MILSFALRNFRELRTFPLIGCRLGLGYLSLMAVVWVGWMDQLVSTGIDKGAASVSEVTHLRRLRGVLRALDIIITAPAFGCYR